MQELIGSKIHNVYVCDGEDYLKFSTDNGDFLYVAEGDCCSETWFSEIINLNYLIGGTVVKVQELELPTLNQEDGNGRQESDCFYGYGINSDKGTTTIVFRNSSNGYYGGDVHLMKDPEKPRPNINFNSIGHLQDWTAYEPTENSYFAALKYKNFV